MEERAGVRLRVAVDGTPLLGIRTGVGHTTAALLDALAGREELELVVYAITLRGRAQLANMVPAGVRAATQPIPARFVRTLWQHAPTPRIERWTGPVDVVHATNFVGPPARAPVVVTVHDLTFARRPDLVDKRALAFRPLIRRATRSRRGGAHGQRLRRCGCARGVRAHARACRADLSGHAHPRLGRSRRRTQHRGRTALRAVHRTDRTSQEPPDADTRLSACGRHGPRPPTRPRRSGRTRLGKRRACHPGREARRPGSCGLATSATARGSTSWPAAPSSRSLPSTKASVTRRSTPWPREYRSSQPRREQYRRCSEMRRSSSIRPMPARWQTGWSRRSTTTRCAPR